MKYEKLYDMILARRETRTITTQNLAIIASSASLLLLILYLPDAKDLQKNFGNLIPVLGIIFPIIGITYHEITYRTIHRFDNEILNNLVLNDMEDASQAKIIEQDVIMYTEKRSVRGFLLYLLLIFPILGWLFVQDPFIGSIVDFIIIMLIIVFNLPPKSSKPKFPKTTIPDFLRFKHESEEDEDSSKSEK